MHELSKALPEEQRPLALDKVQVNDNATFWLPNTGGTAGSTAAEGSCEAVRMACEQLVSWQLHCLPLVTHTFHAVQGRADHGAVAIFGVKTCYVMAVYLQISKASTPNGSECVCFVVYGVQRPFNSMLEICLYCSCLSCLIKETLEHRAR